MGWHNNSYTDPRFASGDPELGGRERDDSAAKPIRPQGKPFDFDAYFNGPEWKTGIARYNAIVRRNRRSALEHRLDLHKNGKIRLSTDELFDISRKLQAVCDEELEALRADTLFKDAAE